MGVDQHPQHAPPGQDGEQPRRARDSRVVRRSIVIHLRDDAARDDHVSVAMVGHSGPPGVQRRTPVMRIFGAQMFGVGGNREHGV